MSLVDIIIEYLEKRRQFIISDRDTAELELQALNLMTQELRKARERRDTNRSN